MTTAHTILRSYGSNGDKLDWAESEASIIVGDPEKSSYTYFFEDQSILSVSNTSASAFANSAEYSASGV